jgi:hypothetical protein
MLVYSDKLSYTDVEVALQSSVVGSVKDIIDLGGGSYLIEMNNSSKQNMLELQRQWNAREDVICASPIFSDGGFEITFLNAIIIKLKSKDDYPVLQKYAEAYKIKDIIRMYQDDDLLFEGDDLAYVLILSHNPEKNAMIAACELYETGHFEYADANLITLNPFGNENPSGNINIVSEGAISVYPNPVNEILFVNLNNQVSTYYNIRLYNIQGSVCSQIKAKDGIVKLDVSSLPAGIYFLSIYEESLSKKPDVHKIIIKH